MCVWIDSVLVDLDVPLAIMREKLRRERGVELNARNGDGFVFVVRVQGRGIYVMRMVDTKWSC